MSGFINLAFPPPKNGESWEMDRGRVFGTMDALGFFSKDEDSHGKEERVLIDDDHG